MSSRWHSGDIWTVGDILGTYEKRWQFVDIIWVKVTLCWDMSTVIRCRCIIKSNYLSTYQKKWHFVDIWVKWTDTLRINIQIWTFLKRWELYIFIADMFNHVNNGFIFHNMCINLIEIYVYYAVLHNTSISIYIQLIKICVSYTRVHTKIRSIFVSNQYEYLCIMLGYIT